MLPLALGFQLVARPVAESIAAIRLRACPPMLAKPPPAYTLEPLTAMAMTEPSGLGFHVVARPVVASSAAILLRGCPPMLEKAPPAYTLEPLTARQKTWR